MTEEMDSLEKNNTKILVDKPIGHKLVGCKWIFEKKEGIPGVESARYKVRLVTKGSTQQDGEDFNEIYSPVMRQSSIRVLLPLVTQFVMELEQLDLKITFSHGTLDEQIHMVQPDGFVLKGNENKFCLLKKSLYGLKQSPCQ